VSDGLRLIVIGPGRAGGSIALASVEAGHTMAGVLSRSPTASYGPLLRWGEDLPEADLALITVKDGAIPEVVELLAGRLGQVGTVAHASGFVPITALESLRSSDTAVGGFHPLQTLPDPDRGSRALSGSYVGVGGDSDAVEVLSSFGESLGMLPFRLDDDVRPAYHAAAAATSNFVVAALSVAFDLYHSAGITPEVSRPLVDRVVSNVYEAGPDSAMTGPVARGDIDTVRGHLAAAEKVSPRLADQYRLIASATAIRVDREGDVHKWK
jgi:predicted short-subunit dehydrogenase-like oxidoreductase (DUF2520 family)